MNLKEKLKECLTPLIKLIVKDIKEVKDEQAKLKEELEVIKAQNAETLNAINTKLEEIRGK